MRPTLRKSLAASAVLASSVAAIAVGSAGSAQAASPGSAGSPLSISDGSGNITFSTHTVHIGGSVTDAAWSPDGGHVAYIDGNGQLAVANAAGGDVRELTHSSATRSHPTWEDGGSEIIFAEGPAAASKLMSVDANGLTMGSPTVETLVAETAGDKGSDTSPDATFRPWNPYDPNTLPLSRLVFQENGQVMILDRNSRGPQAVKLVDGTDPSVAPDGHAAAFVDPGGQIDTVALPVPFDSHGNPAPVITHVTNLAVPGFSHLTWSPDSKTIAAEGMILHMGPTPPEPKDVVTVPAAGGTPTEVRSTPGIPSYQPLNVKQVDRVAGADRIGTAIAASQAVWNKGGDASSVTPHANNLVLSRDDQFADALSGSALAERFGGPLLLTQSAGLNPAVRAEISRVLGAPTSQYTQTVYLLGGEKALSPAVFNAVKAMGYNVQRIGGADRFATSVAVANKITNGSTPQRIFVATGENFADALSAGAAAFQPIPNVGYGNGTVVVLTNDKAMPSATAAYLNSAGHNPSGTSVPTYAIGGQADTALRTIGYSTGGAKQFTPVWGADRYATSLLVAKDFFDGPAKVGFATGLNWTDALSGGALMGHLGGPLLLTDPKAGPSADVTTWLHRTAPELTRALIFGGNVAVAPSVNSAVGSAIAGAAGYSVATNPTGLY
ncbi:cell wall-binding repeat-containing protein [Catenulispora rubra]|uniref:cell wall-binding repeat-containing protein n=1 Tax=Catenulispora rubra TaxID=280293 RepID=UPI00189214FB|nr:cell wall-binding repeat-containing protein [Catenulispora rubra]